MTIYQALCFPLYDIPKVRRSEYMLLDRHRLAYLNFLEKLNCEYCAYGNGVLAYVTEVAARTEQYWCPIKHALRMKSMHSRYRFFSTTAMRSTIASRSSRLAVPSRISRRKRLPRRSPL